MLDALIWLSILPSAILIYYVLKSDKVESEPPRLLLRVFVLGAVGCIPAGILESIGENLIYGIGAREGTLLYSILMFLIVVPCSEELVKLLAMYSIRKNPAFDHTFDGVVYGVMATLGFATLENILYVLGSYSFVTAGMRGILSVPLHCTCGVFMGYFFGLAAWYQAHGQQAQATANRILCFVVPVVIHGIYDFSLDLNSTVALIAGLAFTVAVDVFAIRRVRASSTQDTPFGGVPIHQVPTAPTYPAYGQAGAYPQQPQVRSAYPQQPQPGAYPQQAAYPQQPQPGAYPQQMQAPSAYPQQQGAQPAARPYQQQPTAPTARPYQEPSSPADKNYGGYKMK